MKDKESPDKPVRKCKKWTTEELIAEAAKYGNRTAFVRGSNAAYQIAYRRRLLDDICGHMTPIKPAWTPETIAAEAKKYRTRSAFQRGSGGAYQAARRHGILNKVCKHMYRLVRKYG